jgi:hypothetical protein
MIEEVAVSALQRAIAEVKQLWLVIGWVTKKFNILTCSVLRARGPLNRIITVCPHELLPGRR